MGWLAMAAYPSVLHGVLAAWQEYPRTGRLSSHQGEHSDTCLGSAAWRCSYSLRAHMVLGISLGTCFRPGCPGPKPVRTVTAEEIQQVQQFTEKLKQQLSPEARAELERKSAAREKQMQQRVEQNKAVRHTSHLDHDHPLLGYVWQPLRGHGPSPGRLPVRMGDYPAVW